MFSQVFELKRLCQKLKRLFNEKFAIVLGVVVPQTIYVPNHPPPVVSMVSHPPPPQMGYDTSRMRSRSPPRQAIIERPGKFLLFTDTGYAFF